MTHPVGFSKPTWPSKPGRQGGTAQDPALRTPWSSSQHRGGPRPSQAAVWCPLQLGLSCLGVGRKEEEALPGIYVSQGKGDAAAVGAMVSTCWTGDWRHLHPASSSP